MNPSLNKKPLKFSTAFFVHIFMRFKQWFNEGFNTGCKLGLYAPIDDALGQYPPQYGLARSSDLITYLDIYYKGNPPKGKNGIIKYPKEHAIKS